MGKTRALDISLYLPQPAAPTLAITGGTNGAQQYKLVWIHRDGSHSEASSAVVTAVGPATLDGTHYNDVNWTDIASADLAYVDVYRTSGGTTQGKIGRVAAGVQTLRDNGLAGDAATAPAANTTGVGVETNVGAVSRIWAEVGGTFVGTLKVEGSITGESASWLSLTGDLTAAGFYELEPTMEYVRVSMTAWTSGAPEVDIAWRRY